MRGSTGSFWGDLAAYAIIGGILLVIRVVWIIIAGGKNGKNGDKSGS